MRLGQSVSLSSNFIGINFHMTWVTINGCRYYRRSRRVNGRVVTIHVGGGQVGAAAQALDENERLERKFEESEDWCDRFVFFDSLNQFLQFDLATAHIMQIVAPLSGFRIHKREWRTSRGVSMSTSIDLEKLGRLLDGEVSLYDRRYGSIHCPEFTGIPETDRRTLRCGGRSCGEHYHRPEFWHLVSRCLVARSSIRRRIRNNTLQFIGGR